MDNNIQPDCECRLEYGTHAELNTNSTAQTATVLADNAHVVQQELVEKPMERTRLGPVASTRSDFTNFVDHPVKIAHITWTAALTTAIVTDDLVFNLWKPALPTRMAEKIKSFWYMRAKIKIRVIVQGAAQCYGQMNLNFVPRIYAPHIGEANGFMADNLPENCRIVPHLTIDPSKSQTYELLLPVPTPSGFYDLSSEDQGSYAVYATIINPLRSGTATSSNVNVCIYMSLENPEFEGLTTLIGNDFVDEKKASDYVGSVSYYSSLIAPVVGPFGPAVQLFSQVTGTVADVLRWFGFSKPPATENNVVILNRTCDNYTTTEGISTNAVLGCSQKQSLALTPAYGGGELEEMALSEIFKKPSLITQDFPITSATGGETGVYSFVVSPKLSLAKAAGTGTPQPQSPMYALSKVSDYWCGDMSFLFEFVASAFTRGTFLIAWDPYAESLTPPSFADALAVLQHETVQVVGNTTTTIRIPYKNIMPSLPFDIDQPSDARTPIVPNVDAGDRNSCNGVVYVYVVNPVVDNGGSATVGMNVWTFSDKMVYFAATNEFTNAELYDVDPVGHPFEDEMAPSAQVQFGASGDMSDLHHRVFGDPLKSVKDITSRMDSCLGGDFALSGENNGVSWIGPICPPIPISNPGTIFRNAPSRFGFICAAYLGYRGGVKYSTDVEIILSDSDPQQFGGETIVAKRFLRSATSYPGQVTPYGSDSTGSYAFTTTNLNMVSRNDVFCPMMIPVDFYPTRSTFVTQRDVLQVDYFTANLRAEGAVYRVSVLCGSADDASFVWFLGFPRTVGY